MRQNPYDSRTYVALNWLERTYCMRRPSLVLVLAVFVGLLTAVDLRPSRGADQPPAHNDHLLAVGIVHIEDILNNMAEMKKFHTDGQGRLTELRQQQQQFEVELQDIQKHRDNNLKQGSQQWIDETNKLDDKAAKLEIWKQVAQLQLDRWQKQTLTAMYDHISAAAAQVAESQHLDLIIADQSSHIGPDMDKVDMAKLLPALQSRLVLFANKRADITQDVLTQVDANFAKQGQTPGPPPLPANGAGH